MLLQKSGALGRKLVKRVVFLGLLTALAFSGVIALALWVRLLALSAEVERSAVQATQAVRVFLDTLGTDLLATRDALDTAPEAEPVLRDLLDRRPPIFEVLLLDAQGQVAQHRRRVGTAEPRSHPPTAALPQRDPSHVGIGPVYFEERKDLRVDFEAPFVDLSVARPSSRAGGTLVARVDLTSLWDAVAALEVGDHGDIYVVGEDGRILAYRDQRLLRQSLQTLIGRAPEWMQRSTLKVHRGISGRWVVSTSRPLRVAEVLGASTAQNNWLVILEQPITEALGPLALLGAVLLLALACVLGVILGIVRFVHASIVKPLLDLRGGVLRWQDGDTAYRIDLPQDDELGALATAFNTMASRLATTIETLSFRVGELKRAEEALLEVHGTLEERVRERTEELNSLNLELRSLVQIVTHDLRAPLVNLEGFAGELSESVVEVRSTLERYQEKLEGRDRRNLAAALEADIPEALDFIRSSTSRMDFLINTLLKLSQMGRRELSLEELDMDALVAELLKTLTFQLEQKQAQVHLEPLPRVVADRAAMEQIMGNLLTNAILYLEDDRRAEILVRGERRGQEVSFEIHDTGCGIAEEDLPKIFQPFRRCGAHAVPGEGMGLAYVLTLVRRLGGHIECHSQLHVGSMFRFSLRGDLEVGTSATDSVMQPVI